MERSRKKLPAKTENFGLRVVAPFELLLSQNEAFIFLLYFLSQQQVITGT